MKKTLKVSICPSNNLALTNCVILNSRDFDNKAKYVQIENIGSQYTFSVKFSPDIQSGYIGLSTSQRKWMDVSLNQNIEIASYDPFKDDSNVYISKLLIKIGFVKNFSVNENPYDTEDMAGHFLENYCNQILTHKQLIIFEYKTELISSEVVSIEGDEGIESQKGILTKDTFVLIMKMENSKIQLSLTSNNTARKTEQALINPDFNFEKLGIGGLDKEFTIIFRRAFSSRIFPPSIAEQFGISHVKGLLLYGPPGTGKTLIARQIGAMLTSRKPKIVNGPEILNKYVGQSEENIRNLFKDAEDEYKKEGDDSQLHIIIFDELDAICKQRGSRNDGTGVGDSVVNQLLAKMDGVEALNNILIIGMTNRLDLIDEALLRPGRLEVQLEIGLPDEKGRLQILKIHTKKMKENSLLDDDVSLKNLTERTRNFSGAELAGLIRSAASFSFNRNIKIGTKVTISNSDTQRLKMSKEDFDNALREIIPSFGVKTLEFESLLENGFIVYSKVIENIQKDLLLLLKQIQYNVHTHLISCLLYGAIGSGKSAFAAKVAMESGFPFVKIISPDSFIGMNEVTKSLAIHRIFQDSYKSPLSIILIDDLETLMDFSPLGPRYSNTILQALLVLFKKRPPKDRKLFILCTTSTMNFLEDLSFLRGISTNIYIPNLSSLSHIMSIIESTEVFKDTELNQIREYLLSANLSIKRDEEKGNEEKDMIFSLPIKKLYGLIRMAEEEDSQNRVSKFISCLISYSL